MRPQYPKMRCSGQARGFVGLAFALLSLLLLGALASEVGAQSPPTPQLSEAVVTEGETAVIEITNAPAGETHFLRLKPLVAPYTADSSDFEVRVGTTKAVVNPGAAASVDRQPDGTVQFSVIAQSDGVDDSRETFGIQLCASATDCSGGNLLGDWTLTIIEPSPVVSEGDLDEGLAPIEDLGGPPLGEPVQAVSISDLLESDGSFSTKDGDSKTWLRLIDQAEVERALGGQKVPTSAIGTAYASSGTTDAAGTGASDSANATNWFASDTGQLYLLVGGVNVLFHSHLSDVDVKAILDRLNISPEHVSPLGELPNAFLIKTASDVESLQLADALSAEPGVESATLNTFELSSFGPPEPEELSWSGYPSHTQQTKAHCNVYTDPWPDELSSCSWHLNASTTYRYHSVDPALDPTIDINLSDVWSTTMGQGITVAVVDMKWDPNHEDLKDNVNEALSTKWGGLYSEQPSVGGKYHGTAVAGIIGARDNTVGGRGVAPRVSMVNYNLMNYWTEARFIDGMTRNMDIVAATNHSYGGRAKSGLHRRSYLWKQALETSITDGFGGKGTIHVWAAGNGKQLNSSQYRGVGWATLEENQNQRGVIGVCAVNALGTTTKYSEEGPSLWICAPSSNRDGYPGMLAPMGSSYYTNRMSGTSSSAPIVTGVVALMRAANSNLTWRDVKVILANTAQKNDPTNTSWMTGANKHGSSTEKYSFSYEYGFGVVNAKGAVDAASSWTLLPAMRTATATSSSISMPAYGEEVVVTLDPQAAFDFVEHVKVAVTGEVYDVRHYRWTLVSPSGAESLLSPEYLGCTEGYCSLRGLFDFGSSRHLGENPKGNWKLKIRRYEPTDTTCVADPNNGTGTVLVSALCLWKATFPNVLSSVQIVITGHSSIPADPVTLSTSSSIVAEGDELSVTVTLGGDAPTTDVAIPLAVTPVTATAPGSADADYASLASITVPAGSKSATGNIAITQDDWYEGDETFKVGIGQLPAEYESANGPLTITIEDDETLPTLTLQADSASIVEGGSTQIRAVLSAKTKGDVKTFLSIEPLKPGVPSDAALTQPAKITIKEGQTESPTSVTFNAKQNDVHEISGSKAKQFVVYATAVVSSVGIVRPPAGALIVVTDDDPTPTISIAAEGNGEVTEGFPARFTLTASPTPSAPLTVNVTVTATGDFGVVTGAQTVTMPTTGKATLVVATTTDEISEPSGTITVTVNSGTEYTPSTSASATVSVIDDHIALPPPPASFTVDPALIAEVEAHIAYFTTHNNPNGIRDWTSILERLNGRAGMSDARIATWLANSKRNGWQDGIVTLPKVQAALTALSQAAPIVSISGGADVTEGGNASFTLTSTPAPLANLSVSLTVSASGDYGATTGTRTVTIPTTGSATFTVGTSNDAVNEADGSVTATLDDPASNAGYTVWRKQGAASVAVADDDIPVVSVSGGSGVTEGGNASFTVTASPTPRADLSVSLTISASGDYGATTGTQTVTIPTTGSASFTVATTNDSANEADGSVTATLDAPAADAGYTVSRTQGAATIAVADDDIPVISISGGGDVTEGADVTFTVSANPAPASDLGVKVAITTSGSYGVNVGTYTVTIASGTTSKTLTLPTIDNATGEPDGSVTATLLNGSDFDLGANKVATVSVADDDGTPPTPVVSISGGSGVTEGGNASFTITATPAPTADLSISLTVSASGDYGATTGARTVTIPTGGSATFTVATTDDTTDEPDGSVTATLVDGTDYDLGANKVATVSVTDDDDDVQQPATYTADPQVVAAVQVLASQAHHGTAHVNRWQRALAAMGALDPAGVSGGALTLAEARQNANRFSSPVWDQVVAEIEAKAAFEAAQQTVQPPPTPEVNITASSGGTEGSNVTFTVSATPAPTANLDVNVTITTAGDYGVTAGTQTVTIALGTTSQTLTLPTTNDSTDESDGSVTATLAAGSGYTIGQAASETAQVTDDDDPQQVAVTPVVTISGGAGVTEGGNASFTLTATPAPTNAMSVSVTITASGDYGATTGSRTVTIQTGGSATFTVATTNDTTDEPDGSVTATLVDGSDYDLGANKVATVSVADDDATPSNTVDPALIAEVNAHIADFTARNHQNGIRDWNLILDRLEGRTGMSDARIASWLALSRRHGWSDGVATLPKVQAALAALTTPPQQPVQPPTPEVNITASSGGAEGTNVTFTVSANPAPTSNLDVSLAITTSGDYGVSAGTQTVTISSGTTSQTLTLPTTNDSTDEPDGSVTATLAAGSGYTIGQSASRTAQVTDDDDPPVQPVVTPVVSISGGAGVTEGGSASFTLTANPAPTNAMSVTVTISASGDYGATIGSRTVTIPTGGSVTFSVATSNDSVDEPDGSVTATLVDGADYDLGAVKTATVGVADDDDPPVVTPVVSISGGADVTEGGNASFTLTANPAPTSAMSVTVTITASGDYGATTGSRTVSIGTGGSVTFSVATTNDSVDEPDGSVTATLVDGSDYDLGANKVATVSVADDDDPPTPVVSISGGAGVTEGGNASFTLTANPTPTNAMSVTVTITASGDYGAATGSRTVSIGTGGSVTFSVATSNDSVDEPDGSVTATLVDGSDYDLGANKVATVGVADDDDPPIETSVTISIEDASASESASDLVFRVTLSEASNEDVTVQWATSHSQSANRARGGQGYTHDFWHAIGEIRIRAGETSGTGNVWLNQDSRDEPDEVFTVTLSSPSGATLERQVGTMTIIDDD